MGLDSRSSSKSVIFLFGIFRNFPVWNFPPTGFWIRQKIAKTRSQKKMAPAPKIANYFPVDSQSSKIAKKSTNEYASRDQEELATDVTSVD
jgi:hypothetical protein